MRLWRRLRALSAADRRLLGEAGLMLLRVRVALWIRPFGALRERLENTRPSRPASPRDGDRVGWAVEAVARRLPGATCLVQSLAAQALLRRRGYLPELHIGVRGRGRDAALPLEAHAWLECNGRVVAGAVDDLAEYGVLRPGESPASGSPASP